MALHDELLELASEMAALHGSGTNQATLRRAVSTAYYAMFHLLVARASANWAQPELRAKLSRIFDHGTMRSACEARIGLIRTLLEADPADAPGHDEDAAIALWKVAGAFIQVQQRRNQADYDVAKQWRLEEVESLVGEVRSAFKAWSLCHNDPLAQDFLVSLFGAKDRRGGDSKPPAPPAKRVSN